LQGIFLLGDGLEILTYGISSSPVCQLTRLPVESVHLSSCQLTVVSYQSFVIRHWSFIFFSPMANDKNFFLLISVLTLEP
jgi:hypothetical protein